MMAVLNDDFYAALPLHEMPVNELLANEQLFSAVPEDWHVVITDIEKSTQAVKAGFHQAVNLVATGSIIAALNIGRQAGTAVPFFFGGDGGTLLVPSSLLEPLIPALTEHRENTTRNFGLDLRVGHLPVSVIYGEKYKLKISKVRVNEVYAIPVVLGNGLQYAEKVIKGEAFMSNLPKVVRPTLNLEGMECRWDRIRPPQHAQEVVCLLVIARNDERQAAVFKKVLDALDDIYGPYPDREPIAVPQLKLKATPGKIRMEMMARLGRFDLRYLVLNWFYTFLGLFYFRFFEEGKHYLRRLVQLSDTLVIDGRINTIISGTSQQREQLTAALNHMERAGDLYFGLHTSTESIMSCYVRDRLDQHIHFVDGADGGYTQAAGALKQKLSAAPKV